MKGVNYPVLGVSNNGHEKMMYPGEEYTFPGADYVDEYPQMQFGGEDIPVIEDAGSYNEEGFWVPDWESMKAQAKELNAKTVKTKNGSMIYFDNNWNVQSVDDNPQMKKGGRTRGLIPMPKPSKKGLASKKYSRSLEATNRLFTENKLFKKPKSRKNKVFDPRAKYYQDGGQQDAMNAMMKARLAYANEFGNPAAQRMINIPDNPYKFDNGDEGTHYMASMDNYAVPQIQDENGQLMLGDYGPESAEAMRFDSDNDADYFAEHYKDIAPGFVDMELDDNEIQQYVKGGYVVEEINDPSIPKLGGFAKGGAQGCPQGTYWNGTKCTKLVTLKSDKKYIDGVANWAMHVSDPNMITSTYNDNIKDRLYSGKWGFDPESGALVRLDKIQPQSVTTLDAKTKASREKEKLTEQNYKAEEENKKAYDKSITDAGFDPATFGKAKGVNTITGEPIYASSKEEADKINQEAINQAAIEGHAAVVNNPVFKTAAYMTPVGMAIGVMEGAARLAPDVYDFAKDPSWSGAGQIAMDVVETAPLAKPLASAVKAGAKGLSKGVKGVANYGNDIIQTSKQAGKIALPKYKNVYRVEHAGFNQAANADDLTGRWFADNPIETKFYAQNLKDPVTGEVIKNVDAPTRVMQQRLPEYKVQQNFGAGMPEEARMMSMGKGDLTNSELDEMLGPGAGDRFTKGSFTESDLNSMETAPFLFRKEEGILDADMVNKLRGNTNAGRFSSGKSTVFNNQGEAVDYLFDEGAKTFKPKSKYSQYIPFKEGGSLNTYAGGGETQCGDNEKWDDRLQKCVKIVQNLSESTHYDPAGKKVQATLFQKLKDAKDAYQNFTKQHRGKKYRLNEADSASSIEQLRKGIQLYKAEYAKEQEQTKHELKKLENLKSKAALKDNKDIQNLTLNDLNTVKGKMKIENAIRNSDLDSGTVAAIYTGFRLDEVDPNVKRGTGSNKDYSAIETKANAMKDVPQFVDMVSKVATAIPLVGAAGALAGTVAPVANVAGKAIFNPVTQAALAAPTIAQMAMHPLDTVTGVATTGVELYDKAMGDEDDVNRFGNPYWQDMDDLINTTALLPGIGSIKAAREFLKTRKGFNFAKNYIKPVKDVYKKGVKRYQKATAPFLNTNVPGVAAGVVDSVIGGRGATEVVNKAGQLLQNAPAWANPTVGKSLSGLALGIATVTGIEGASNIQEGFSDGNKEKFDEGIAKTVSAVTTLSSLTPVKELATATTPLVMMATTNEIKDNIAKKENPSALLNIARLINQTAGLPIVRNQVAPTQSVKAFRRIKRKHIRKNLGYQKGGIVSKLSQKEIDDLIAQGYIIEELD
jgi:hypothetical protein